MNDIYHIRKAFIVFIYSQRDGLAYSRRFISESISRIDWISIGSGEVFISFMMKFMVSFFVQVHLNLRTLLTIMFIYSLSRRNYSYFLLLLYLCRILRNLIHYSLD